MKEGDILFELDARSLKAQLGQIEAQIRKDQAQVTQAKRDLQRIEELLSKNAGTVVQRDNAADRREGRRSPARSRRGRQGQRRRPCSPSPKFAPRCRAASARSPTRRAPSCAPATTRPPARWPRSTRSTRSMSRFAIPQIILPDLRAAMAKGPVTVTAIIDDSKKQSGEMAFIENTVDPNTGTVTAKARIGNANELLWPGQFVKVEIVLGIESDAISVPASAVQLGSQGPYRVRRQGRRGRTQAGRRQAHAGRPGGDRQGRRRAASRWWSMASSAWFRGRR